MPINISITAPDGAVATYHVYQGVQDNQAATPPYVSATFAGWLDYAHYTSGAPPVIATAGYDVTALLAMAPPTPSFPTYGQQLIDTVEKFLIEFTMPNPASTDEAPLPNIQSIFYGGAQVS